MLCSLSIKLFFLNSGLIVLYACVMSALQGSWVDIFTSVYIYISLWHVTENESPVLTHLLSSDTKGRKFHFCGAWVGSLETSRERILPEGLENKMFKANLRA